MKKLLKLSVFAGILILIAISCQKVLTKEDLFETTSGKVFNIESVKNWYYGTFEKTAEWKTSWPIDKKFPDWKNGNSYKLRNLEIMEFPLLKGKTRLYAPLSSLTTEEIKKIVNASLTRVVFIKNSKEEISVRQVDYIPSLEYLQKKQFDISEVAFGQKDNDFTGTMVVKNWEGDILTIRLLTNGKITHKATYKKTNLNSNKNIERNSSHSEECAWVTFCMMYQDCEVVGDVVTENCGEPYPDPNDCYDEYVCIWVEDEDPCEVYAIGCEEEEEEEGGTDVTVQRDLLIKRQITGYENWEINGTVSLTGRVFTNPSLNYFTSCTSPGSVFTCFQANCGWNVHSLYIQYTELSRTTGLTDPVNAAASFNTKIVYPNWPGGANTVYYQGAHTWNAAQDLP